MKQTIENLSRLQMNISGNDFIHIFGDDIGIHLWRKYQGYRYNLLELWCVLDYKNRELLKDYINKFIDDEQEQKNRKEWYDDHYDKEVLREALH